MRIMVLCPHFEPDLHAATGEVMTALVAKLVEQGHQISLVTALPWYRNHRVEHEWGGRPWRRETKAWGEVIRVWPFPTNKTNITARAVGFAGFTALATGAALSLGRADLVMAMSPPIFLGDAAWLVSKIRRIPFVFNTQDIFPDVAVDLGALTNPRVIDLAERHERSLYRRASAVTVLSEDQAVNVRSKLPNQLADRVRLIPNFVDLDRVRVGERNNSYRTKHNLGSKTVVMYSGNVGLSQSFDLVRRAGEHFSTRADIHFVINGEGAARPDVDRWAASLDNVSVVDFAPRDQVGEVLAAADIHLVLLKSGLARSSTPSKLYGILAAGRPVLASIDEKSEVATVVSESGAGIGVAPDNAELFIEALAKMVDDPILCREMGLNGRRFAERWLTADQQATRYGELFDELVSKPQ